MKCILSSLFTDNFNNLRKSNKSNHPFETAKIRMSIVAKVILLLFLLSASFIVRSQSVLTEVVPLTPNVAELNKYGDYNVSALTGRTDISIPLYTVELGDLKVPINLSYFASGIRVSQLATWVGLGWSLNAGGVISRAVRGLPDNTQSEGWIDDPTTYEDLYGASNYDFLRAYADLFKDPAPDFFSYNMNGHSAKFIFKKAKHEFETVPYEQTKIEWRNYQSSGNDFCITDGQGIRYIFGFTQLYSRTESPAGVPQPLSRYTQAWHLTEMISANSKDTIRFEYKMLGGSSVLENGFIVNPEWSVARRYQHVYSSTGSGPFTDEGISQQTTFCTTAEPSLSQIVFRTGKVVFHARSSRKDFPGPQLDSITVYRFNDTGDPEKIYKYRFSYSYFSTNSPLTQYDYRLKLTSLTQENVMQGDNGQTHEFFYNESIKLPSTSSTAQDFWGFYNGREGGFLPNVPPSNSELFQWYHDSPVGAADRSASDEYTKAGILEKIVYPTKGFTTFIYEPNKYKSQYPVNEKYYLLSNKYVQAKSKGIPYTENYEFEWTSDMYQNLGTIDYYFSPHTDPGPFSVEDMQQIILTDLTTGSQVFYRSHSTNFTTGFSESQSIYFTPGHRYRVAITVRDEPSTELNGTYIRVSVSGTRTTTQSLIKSGGGLRIKEIVTNDSPSNVAKREKYSYSSSAGEGIGFHLRSDEDFNKPYFYRTQVSVNSGCVSSGGSPCQCLWDRKTSIIYIGEGNVPQVTLQGAEVVYSSAIKEEYGKENEINGKVEYSAPFAPNVYSNSIYNPGVPGQREYIDNILDINIKPSERFFSLDKTTGNFTLVKEKLNYYSLFNSTRERVQNVYRVVFYPDNCVGGANLGSLNDFTQMGYEIGFGAYKLTKSTEKNYYGSPLDTVAREDILSYDNLKHLLPTRIIHKSSDGATLTTINKYPQDFSGNEYGSGLLRAAFINDRLIEFTSSLNGTEVLKKATDFRIQGNCIVPDHEFESTGGKPLEAKINFLKYDDKGKLLEISRPFGPRTCYIWGYSATFPIAKVENIDYDVLNSRVGLSTILDFREKLNPNRVELTDFFSRIRSLLPKDASLNTFTYDPLVGMTSQTDSRGQTTYYEYDGFQRLREIKDDQRKTIKKYAYNYSVQGSGVPVVTYLSSAKDATVTKNDCPSGYTGSAVTYVVPAGKYSSTISQEDANAKAQADVEANKQSNANASGSCSVIACTGNDKKIINGVCQTGNKEYLSSIEKPGGKYLCTFKYVWSDGTSSATYSETTTYPCL